MNAIKRCSNLLLQYKCRKVSAFKYAQSGTGIYSNNMFYSTIAVNTSTKENVEDSFCRQRNKISLGLNHPMTAPDVYVAPNALLIGLVDLFDKVGIWYGCVLRADLNSIYIGPFTNIQDRTIIHAARSINTGLSAAVSIGDSVTIGRNCLIRSARVDDDCVIGDRCILLEGSVIKSKSILAPGTVLPPGKLVPSGQLWAGNPAKYVRDLTEDEVADIPLMATELTKLVQEHRTEFQLNDFQYVHAGRIRKAMQEAANFT